MLHYVMLYTCMRLMSFLVAICLPQSDYAQDRERRRNNWRRGSDKNFPMAAYGRLAEFNPFEEFTTYLERVERFFVTNNIPVEKTVPIFLNCIGGATYELLCSFAAPANPKDKTLDKLSTTLKAHFEQKHLVIDERFHIHKRNQIRCESVTEYLAELCKMAAHCLFQQLP